MFRRSACVLVGLLFLVAAVSAEDYKGKVAKVDAKKGNLTVKMGDKTMDFEILFSSKIFDKEGKESTGKKRLAILTTDADVVVTTEKKKVGDVDKDVVTKVQLAK